MPGTRRTPIGRTPLPVITPQAVALFERGIKLQRRKQTDEVEREFNHLRFELDCALKRKPWEADVLTDCDCKEPPTFLRSPDEIEDWWKSRRLREALQDALRERQKAEREARKA